MLEDLYGPLDQVESLKNKHSDSKPGHTTGDTEKDPTDDHTVILQPEEQPVERSPIPALPSIETIVNGTADHIVDDEKGPQLNESNECTGYKLVYHESKCTEADTGDTSDIDACIVTTTGESVFRSTMQGKIDNTAIGGICHKISDTCSLKCTPQLEPQCNQENHDDKTSECVDPENIPVTQSVNFDLSFCSDEYLPLGCDTPVKSAVNDSEMNYRKNLCSPNAECSSRTAETRETLNLEVTHSTDDKSVLEDDGKSVLHQKASNSSNNEQSCNNPGPAEGQSCAILEKSGTCDAQTMGDSLQDWSKGSGVQNSDGTSAQVGILSYNEII